MSGPLNWMSEHCLPGGLKAGYEKWKYEHPVWWASFGGMSRLIGRALPTREPSVLVLSLPRSGSSWMGSTLSLARNALYLREPLTRTKDAPPSVLSLDGIEVPDSYERAARLSFTAMPQFPRSICQHPWEWKLSRRRKGRVVVKEVNPYMVKWVCEEYRPRVVLLVRHPAGVALSYRKFGWWDSPEGEWDQPDCWRIHGDYQGASVRFALSFLEEYGNYEIVRYEDLCADPVPAFRDVFGRVGIEWTEAVEQRILGRVAERDPRQMIRSWEKGMTNESLAEMRRGYEPHGLPFYREEGDWRLEGHSDG